MSKATSAFLLAMVALVAYGVFATFYWPITAISADVWGVGYGRAPTENVIAMLVGTFLWLVLAVTLSVLGLRRRRPPLLTCLGITAIALVFPTTLASVAVYNVIPTSMPYPDNLTPLILLAGLALSIIGIAVAGVARRRRQTQPPE